MFWVLFSILAALFWAAVNIIDKYVIGKLINNPFAPSIVWGFLGPLVAVIVFTVHGIDRLPIFLIGLAFLVAILSEMATVVYFFAAKKEEISRIVALLFLIPLFVAIIAGIFLGEIFTPIKYLGIVLLVAGATLISTRNYKIKLNKPFWFTIVAALLWASVWVIEKYLLNFTDTWTVFAYMSMGAFLTLPIMLYFAFSDLQLAIRSQGKRILYFMTLGEILGMIAFFFMLSASSLGPVTFVSALVSVQPFFVLVMATAISFYYPKIMTEETSQSTLRLKVLAIILMFIGGILVT